MVLSRRYHTQRDISNQLRDTSPRAVGRAIGFDAICGTFGADTSRRVTTIPGETVSRRTAAALESISVLAVVVALSLGQLPAQAHAKDFGISGEIFRIKEKNLLTEIKNRLSRPGVAERFRAELQKEVSNQESSSQTNFVGKKLPEATNKRVWFYDPSVSFSKDLSDHQGKVFYRKGTKVNPLDHLQLGKEIIVIDGRSAEQQKFALNRALKLNQAAKIILTTGSPIKMMERAGFPVYFDYHGKVTTKLGIKHVPAIVSQQGNRLRIEEVVL